MNAITHIVEITKLQQAKNLYDKGDKINSLKIVGRFPRLGDDKNIIKLGIDCINNRNFYIQLNYDCDKCIENALEAIKRRYKW